MGIFMWVAIGLLLGSVARLLMPGPSAGGMAVALVVGVCGAVIGGSIGAFLGAAAPTALDFRSLVMAFCGAFILLFSYRCAALRATDLLPRSPLPVPLPVGEGK